MSDQLNTSEQLSAEAQAAFDAKYISATEIQKRMNVSRTAVLYARRSGKLPGSIVVNSDQLYIWERSAIEPHLQAWEATLNFRRNVS